MFIQKDVIDGVIRGVGDEANSGEKQGIVSNFKTDIGLPYSVATTLVEPGSDMTLYASHDKQRFNFGSAEFLRRQTLPTPTILL